MKSIIMILLFLACITDSVGQHRLVKAEVKDLSQLIAGENVFTSRFEDIIGPHRDINIKHVLVLEVNPDINVQLAKSFRVALIIQILRDGNNENLPAETKKIEVNYSTAGQYHSKDGFVVDNSKNVIYKLISVSLKDENGAEIPISQENKNIVFLKQELQFDRYLEPDLNNSITTQSINVNFNKGYANLIWNSVPWALAYDIEYTYIDNYTSDIKQILTAQQTSYDFRFNSTRVQLEDTSYEIPLVYESGFLIFRVRPVSNWGKNLDKFVTGQWSVPDLGRSLIFNGLGEENVFFSIIDNVNIVHENDQKNWQYKASFSEHGRRTDIVDYLDGTLRSRQTITSINSQKGLLVDEKIYDNNGRPAIKILPTPIISKDSVTVHTPKIQYQNNFNLNNSKAQYSWKDFDIDRECLSFPDPLSTASGASQYYSTQNPFKDANSEGFKRQIAFVADANGFPFTQIEYTPDNTGRIKRQGGPGNTNKLGSTNSGTHEQKFYYSVPAQEELDKVFGNDIGFAYHYSKEVRVDENGQAYVSYKDQRGNVIATALTGISPTNLNSINENKNSDTITVHLIDENNRIDNGTNSLISYYPLIVTQPTTLNINYNLMQNGFTDTICRSENKLCYDCIYDLSINIIDDCGKNIFSEQKTIGTLENLRECEAGAISFKKDSSLDLQVGEYKISKILTVNENAVNTYVNTYISDYLKDSCWKIPFKPISCVQKDCTLDTVKIDSTCRLDENSKIKRPPVLHLPVPGLSGVAECTMPVADDFISKSLQKMLADLSPGGQYCNYPDLGSGNVLLNISNYPLSILNENNKLRLHGNWRHPIVPYRNANGTDVVIEKNENGQLKKYKPEELSNWDEFVQYWKPSMAYSLLPYHPEYCYYEWCITHKDYFDYERQLFNTNTFTDAQRDFKILTTPNFITPDDKDPLFKDHPSGACWGVNMTEYMSNISLLQSQPGLQTIKLSELAAISAAGFSNSVSQQQITTYLLLHKLYSIPAKQDEEWNTFKTYYLHARTKILECLRMTSTDTSCCVVSEDIGNMTCRFGMNSRECSLYSNKIPVFISQGQIPTIINRIASGNPLLDIDTTCINCTQPQSFLSFFNQMLEKGKLFTNEVLPGSLLSLIANSSTDDVIASGHHVIWMPTKNATGLTGILVNDENTSTICTINMSTSDNSFRWDSIIGFSCLDAQNLSHDFTITAFDNEGNTIKMSGHTDCTSFIKCTKNSKFIVKDQFEEYTPLFIKMLEQVLKSANNNKIPRQTVNGRNPANLFYLPKPDPVHVWKIISETNMASGSFSIPLSLTLQSNAQSARIDIQSTIPFVFNNFKDWKIINYKLNSTLEQKDTCKKSQSITITVELRSNPETKQSFTAQFNSFDLGNACEVSQNEGFCCIPILPIMPVVSELSCEEIQLIQYQHNEEIRIDSIKKQLAMSLRAKYIEHCLKPIETFDLTYDERIYHYTLNYYDQAGNLIKTVPPKGIQPLKKAEIEQAYTFRYKKTGSSMKTHHTMGSIYKFNSLNSVVVNRTPDGNETNYCYDELGRIIYKQDAEQKSIRVNKRALFIAYDPLGRTIQTGQIPVNQYGVQIPTHEVYQTFSEDLESGNKFKEEVFTTYYDRTPIDKIVHGKFDNIDPANFNLKNLRNRVSATIYHRNFQDNNTYEHAFFYNYDIEGNVDTVYQDFRYLEAVGVKLNLCDAISFHRLKKIAYKYDLISKKVSMVWYQPDQIDQFIQKYDYDADNRLAAVRTSTRIWEDDDNMDNDAGYQYYLNGPLARTELGQEKIQGLDYAYTIQGWMKGMNSSTLNSARDIGKDEGTSFLKDVVAFGLNYYTDDYVPIAGNTQPFFIPEIKATKLESGFSKPLFNGNIRNMITAIDAPDFNDENKIQASAYSYDVLNRITNMQVYHPVNAKEDLWADGDFTEAYRTHYAYDANGNIDTLKRNNESGKIMDDLTYSYTASTNQVNSVVDVAGKVNNEDLDNNSTYTYDPNGRLENETEAPTVNTQLKYKWASFDKLRNIEKNGENIEIKYNAIMQRAWKYEESTNSGIYYVRDLQGNTLAIYKLTPDNTLLTELPIYGSSRLGTYNIHLDLKQTNDINELTYFRGSKQYELTNHVGNLLATVSDRRVPLNGVWTPDIITAQDYYPFGSIMPGRSFNAEKYRYGITGKEMDNEIKGFGDTYDFGARFYNPRIGKWISVDPSQLKYPSFSPYNYCVGNPLKYFDPNGQWLSDGLVVDDYTFGLVHKTIGLVHQQANSNAVWQYALSSGKQINFNEIDQKISALNRGTVWADEFQSSDKTYMHAMSNDMEPIQVSRFKSNEFVQQMFAEATNYKSAGDLSWAYFYLGASLHTPQDATSPEHNDFRPWNDIRTLKDGFRAIKHGLGERTYPGLNSNLQKVTNDIFNKFENNESLPKKELFDNLGKDK